MVHSALIAVCACPGTPASLQGTTQNQAGTDSGQQTMQHAFFNEFAEHHPKVVLRDVSGRTRELLF